MPKISVLMPVYNTPEEYLREAIESILNQTYTDFEFLILDGGSTNNVAEVVKSYTDKRIKYLYREHDGLSSRLNWGFDLAEGEFIARMDSDDISLPERFAKQVEYLEMHPDVSLVGTWTEMFPRKKIPVRPAEVGFMDLVKSCCIAHPTVMYRRADFAKYNLKYNTEFDCAEDYELWSRAIRYVKLHNIPEVLFKYRVHGGQISTARQSVQRGKADIVRQRLLDLLSKDSDVQRRLKQIISPNRIYSFLGLPLLKVRTKSDVKRYYLFAFIPVFCKKRYR